MDLTIGTQEAIAFVISVLVGLLGPKPIEAILGFLKLEGQWAVLATYVIAFLVGLAGLAVAGQLLEIEYTLDNVVAIAGLLASAASYSYHRLKDRGSI